MSRGGGSRGASALLRVDHKTGGVLGPEGTTSEEFEPEKAFVPEPEADGREKTRPTTRVSRN